MVKIVVNEFLAQSKRMVRRLLDVSTQHYIDLLNSQYIPEALGVMPAAPSSLLLFLRPNIYYLNSTAFSIYVAYFELLC